MAKKTIISLAVTAALIAGSAVAGLANAQSYPSGTGSVGYLQINGAAVTDVSSANAPSTVTVTLAPYPYNTATIPFVDDSSGTCYQYATQFSTNPTLVYCPAAGANAGIESIATYNVQVTPSTQIVLNDGTAASAASIAPGDQLNVFGYFDGSNNIAATTIRDISKPATYAYAYVYPQGPLALNTGAGIATTAGTEVTANSSVLPLTALETEIQAIVNELAIIRTEIATGQY